MQIYIAIARIYVIMHRTTHPVPHEEREDLSKLIIIRTRSHSQIDPKAELSKGTVFSSV